jgi:hypothetical protein
MSKVKTITTTIEDEVVFMTDPEVQFVSLVKHGANRTPFKVFKTATKEETGMKKVVQSLLVRNDLPEDQMAKALEGMSKKESNDTGTITSYTQLPLTRCDEDTLMVEKNDEIDGVFFVTATLKEGESDSGTLEVESEKEAVDYATLDNLYTELYAMADIVSGAMRQENAGVEFRKDTIISAIDNFRTFAEVVLNNLGVGEKADFAVKAEDHPTLLPFIKTEEAEAEEAAAADAAADEDGAEKSDEEVGAETDDEKSETPSEGDEDDSAAKTAALVFDSVNEVIGKMAEKMEKTYGTITKSIKEVGDATEAIKKEVDELKLTTVSSKSTTDEDITEKKAGSPFKGVLFNR